MEFNNTYPSKFSSIPRTIILEIDENEVVIKSSGKQLSELKININNRKLIDLFNQKTYKDLKTIVENKIDNLIIEWNGYKYEVSYEQIDNSSNFIFYFFDVTKYTNIEFELKESMTDLVSKKEELQAVFDLAANGISILDKDGMFLYANNFFQMMMGYTMEELYEESCISLSSDEYKEPSKSAVERTILEGSVVNFRKVCVSKSGEHMNASMSLSYLKSQNQILMITSDITDDIKYQEELKSQVEEEVKKRTEQYEVMCHQSRLAAMGEMLDSIAHQWRQPLNGLGLIVQGLRHINNSKELNKNLLEEIEVEIMEKINYMSQTIDDFSDFFRISKKMEKFELLKNILDAIRLIDVQLKMNKIEVNVNIEEDIHILGFANEFRQVIMNMVHNSMMAIINTNKKDGLITIEILENEKFITILINDNGGGIKIDNISKIFDPYFTTREKGSGIGLYMSKMIIEHHMKGKLKVKNHEEGTQFSIQLEKRN